MIQQNKVELHLEISSKVLAGFKQELGSEYGTITQDILNHEQRRQSLDIQKQKNLS